MAPPYKVKITVIKKTFHSDLVDELTTGPDDWREGTHMPDGFPDPPWVDIQKYVFILGRGGNMLGVENGTYVTNCTDGFRPVTFKLERIEE